MYNHTLYLMYVTRLQFIFLEEKLYPLEKEISFCINYLGISYKSSNSLEAIKF